VAIRNATVGLPPCASPGDPAREPGHGQSGDAGGIPTQVVALPGPDHHLHRAARHGHTERVGIATDHERGHRRIELPRATRLRPAWWVEGEGEREDARGADLGRRPAGDPGSGGAPPDDHGKASPHPPANRGDDRDKGGVELRRGCRSPAAGEPVRLGDAGDGEAGCDGGIADRDEISCIHTARGTVPEHEHPGGTPRPVERDLGLAVRGVDAECLRYPVGASSRTGTRGVGSITGRESLLGWKRLAAEPGSTSASWL
jgi:hypothetical protein